MTATESTPMIKPEDDSMWKCANYAIIKAVRNKNELHLLMNREANYTVGCANNFVINGMMRGYEGSFSFSLRRMIVSSSIEKKSRFMLL